MVVVDGGASAYGGSIPPLPTILPKLMNLDQIIAYIRGTTEFAALTEPEKRAVADGDTQALASILNARIAALNLTDPTQAASVREVLRVLNSL